MRRGRESSHAPRPVRAAETASSSPRLAAVTGPEDAAPAPASPANRAAAAPGETWAPLEGEPVGAALADPAGRGRWRKAVVYLSILGGLALLVGGVWGFGGLQKRTDIQRPIAPGQRFVTGPYEFSFTGATAQQTRDAGSRTTVWTVTVLGEGRTTGKESVAPEYVTTPDGMFALKDPGSGRIVYPTSTRVGSGEGFRRSTFTPGLPLVPYALTFTLDKGYQPGTELLFGAVDLVYGRHFLTNEQKVWHNGTYLDVVRLPVRVLPAKLQ